ncbi:hypothetical protein Gpo141_00014630, partial [Globisporangium polare]
MNEFVQQRESIARFVRDAIALAVDKQKASADQRGRKHKESFVIGDRVLLSTAGIAPSAVTNLGAVKLAPRFIGPFKVIKARGDAYKLDIPTTMKLHPTFYVGRLKRYWAAEIPSEDLEPPRPRTGVPDDARAEPPLRLVAAAQRAAPSSPRGEPDSTAQASRDEFPTRRLHPRSAQPRAQPPTRGREHDQHPQTSSGPVGPAPLQVRRSVRLAPPSLRSFQRDAPPPLVDSAGDPRWIVDRLLDHCDPPNRSRHDGAFRGSSAIPDAREYRVRWLGFQPTDDTWEPRASMMADVPDLVRAYEAAASASDSANQRASALVASESEIELSADCAVETATVNHVA